MITSYMAVICERAIEDASTHNLCLIEVLDEIRAPAYPVLFQKLAVVFSFRKDDADPDQMNLMLRGVLGDIKLMETPFTVAFGGRNRSRCLFELAGFPIPALGEVRFTAYDGDRVVGECGFMAQPMLATTVTTTPTKTPSATG